MNPYYTHQKYLIQLLNSFNYDKIVKCLEFGTGDGSSSVFYDYCKKETNINVLAFEHDLNWLNTVSEKYKLPNYTFNHVNWGDLDYNNLKSDTYDLVFVDQGDWDARIKTIDELKNSSKYIILHDYCYYNGFRGFEIPLSEKDKYLTVSKGSFFYEKYGDEFELSTGVELFPPTLIMKNKIIC